MKALPLKTKLIALILGMIILIAVVLTLQTYRGITSLSDELSDQTALSLRESAVNRLKTSAHAFGEEVRGFINGAYRVPMAMARVIQGSIDSGEEPMMSREEISELSGDLLRANPDISSSYAQFEVNGYDNLDQILTGDDSRIETSVATGSLEIYWVREPDGSVEQQKVEDPEEKYLTGLNEFGIRESEWYLCARDTKKPCLMEPYLYEIEPGYSEMMTSLTAPIVINGKFRGVAGVDVNLPIFQKLTETASKNLFDGQAKVTLLSDMGLIVASSHYKEKSGRPLKEVHKDIADTLLKLPDNDSLTEIDGNIYVSHALNITASGSRWALLIELPTAVALQALYHQQQVIEDAKNAVVGQQILGTLILLAAALVITTMFIRSITSPLQKLNSQVGQLASSHGDLTQSLKLDTHAELIELSGGFNAFIGKLRDMINALKTVSDSVRSMSADNKRISEKTRENTDSQQHEMDNVVTATEEMSATAQEVSRIAADAAGKAKDIHSTVISSQKTLSDAAGSVQQLTGAMKSANDSISKVASRSDAINGILLVIRNVAEQTNLLALNAAIEAARAGEQGRGFAVVADEVRTLASKTQESTAEIDALISSLQDEVKTAVGIIEEGSERAEGAMNSTRYANESLHSVVESIGGIADHIHQVATAAEEQSSVSNEITRTLTVIGQATQTLAELAQEASSGSNALSGQVDILDAQLNQLNT